MEVPGRILNRIQKSFKCKGIIGDGDLDALAIKNTALMIIL